MREKTLLRLATATALSFFVLLSSACGNPPRTIADSGKISGIYEDEIQLNGNSGDSNHLSCYLKGVGSVKYVLHDFFPLRVEKIPDLRHGERAWIRCRDFRKDGQRFLGGKMEIHCRPDSLPAEPPPALPRAM